MKASTFFFSYEDAIHLHFTLDIAQDTIVVCFSEELDLTQFGSRFVAACSNIGFVSPPDGRPEYRYPASGFKGAWEIKIVLSRLLFDLLGIHRWQVDGRIVYKRYGRPVSDV
ncbi:hypothetical protein [Pedobacter sp. SYP-B3415]|uniref:hypothetical protein n=1 Tax=Pedobacter sp. SYP-B3415 TaxID=2496641 RepID=UPI0013EDD37C|nr:hypothetical protein [Pedobacter sp. SYP-B3415]